MLSWVLSLVLAGVSAMAQVIGNSVVWAGSRPRVFNLGMFPQHPLGPVNNLMISLVGSPLFSRDQLISVTLKFS